MPHLHAAADGVVVKVRYRRALQAPRILYIYILLLLLNIIKKTKSAAAVVVVGERVAAAVMVRTCENEDSI